VSALSAAKRRARTPRLLRISQVISITGAVLAAAATVGPIWMVRAGVALAVLAGVGAVIFAVRELNTQKRRTSALLLRQTKEHGAALTAERRHNAEVVDVLTERVGTRAAELDRQRGQNRRLGTRIAELTSANATLRSELTARELTIAGLRETVRSRDTEIQLLRADLDLDDLAHAGAEVQGLPRRRDAERAGAADTADRPATDDETVIDLPAVEKVLPNFEVDRKHA
jgi:hypothetical protein